MKKILLLVICLAIADFIFAQQLPLFTQYRENTGLINPAAVNHNYLLYEHNTSVGASYRIQWAGFENAPRTQTIHGDYLYDTGNAFSFLAGGYLINDQTGPTGFTGAYGRFSGIISDDPYYSGIAVGLAAGIVQYRVNSSEIRLRELGDNLASQDQTQLFPDVGFGVYAYQYLNGGFLDESMVYGGISVPQVFGLNLKFEDENGAFYTERVQHYYALLGLYKYFRDDSFLEPSVWFKYTPNAPVNIDFNLRYQMASNFWLGTGLATSGTAHVEVGFILGENSSRDNNFRIGYGLDYSFNSYGPSVGSTHEINVAYSFGN